jgi:hypothetical protein
MPVYYIVILVIVGIALGIGSVVAQQVIEQAIRLRARHWFTADSEYVSGEDTNLAPDVTGLIDDLKKLGFVFRGYWEPTSQFSIAQSSHVALLEHPKTLDVAKVLFIVNSYRQDVVLAFQSLLHDGAEVTTENSPLPSGFPPRPEVTVFWLPEIRDARQLYLVHEQARDGVGLGKKRRALGHDAVVFLSEGANRVNIYRIQIGYYFLDETNNVYRLTWKGAFLTTCRFLRPTARFYRAWRRHQTRKRLRKLGVRLDLD